MKFISSITPRIIALSAFLPEQIPQQSYTTALYIPSPSASHGTSLNRSLPIQWHVEGKIFTQKILLRLLRTPSIQLHKLLSPLQWALSHQLCLELNVNTLTVLGCRCQVSNFARFQKYGHQVFYLLPCCFPGKCCLGSCKVPRTAAHFTWLRRDHFTSLL
jgi:hypothetical protein